jgi:ribosome-binding factor A
MTFQRSDRVAEAIKREMSLLIMNKLKEPDMNFVTVTAVESSKDLRHAKIFISVLGDESTKEHAMLVLETSKKFLRKELGQKIRLRYTPEIQFILDRSLDHAMRIKQILDQIKSNPSSTPEASS